MRRLRALQRVGEPKVPDLQLRETKIVEPETTQGQSGILVQLDSSDAAATEDDQAECSCIGSGCCSVCQVFDNQENQIRQIEPRPGVYFLEILKDGKALDQINLGAEIGLERTGEAATGYWAEALELRNLWQHVWRRREQ
ncbi:hypothetical protein F0562_025499 [Nyssa sinensis]|uniref:Uncharacterized protein n=1 Tax=Nyssa sinensis TaxID=561372 RepID=A0A5J5BAL5_9ASTE|nr:hypothetical protein F0562_025499 [Nyssa sinensis]